MSLFNKLLDNKWGKKLIKLFKKENKILRAVDFRFIDTLYRKYKKNKRGRKKVYLMSQLFKLCCEAFQNGITSAKAIERYVKKPLVKITHELAGYVSHDVISRFFITLGNIIKEIFYRIVREIRKLGLVYPGLIQVIDGTDLPTRFKKDEDAKWNYDSTAKKYYFGYGVLLLVDPIFHLPLAAKLTKGKKVNTNDSKEVCDKGMILQPSVILGDSEFDIIELMEYLLDNKVLLVTPYNKRNSNEELNIRFRAEMYGFNKGWMRKECIYRPEVEHAISTLKEHFHLLDFHVRGWKKVESHLFFVLSLRLLHGIATFKEGKNPRQITHI